MALDRIVSMVLRAAELAFAAIVAGVTGDYLHKSHADAWAEGRFIYTEVVAGLSILLALLWLLPFSSTFVHWPVDIFVSILWWVVFGLLVDVSTQNTPKCNYTSYAIVFLFSTLFANRFLLLLSAYWQQLRWHLQLVQRSSPRRPMRPIQG